MDESALIPGRGPSLIRKLDPIRGINQVVAKRKERTKVLTENERAGLKIAEATRKILSVVNHPDWINQETAFENRQGGKTWTNYSLDFPGVDELQNYNHGFDLLRDGQDKTIFSFADYIRPQDQEYYSTGINDGIAIVQINPIDDTGLGNITFSGDLFLGRQGLDDPVAIKEIKLEPKEFSITLGDFVLGESFRFSPDPLTPNITPTTVIMDAVGWGEDPKTHEKIGPIGPIKELRFLAIGRKETVTDTKDPADTQSLNVLISDIEKDQAIPVQLPGKHPVLIYIKKRPEGIEITIAGTDRSIPVPRDPKPDLRLKKNSIFLPNNILKAEPLVDKFTQFAEQIEKSFQQKQKNVLPEKPTT